MAYQLPMLGLLAMGMMISILSGGINLSIVANANLNGIIIALVLRAMTDGNMMSASVPVTIIACLAGLAVTIAIGLFNGMLISMLKIPAILVTLGSMTLLNGISILLTRGRVISGFPMALLEVGNGRIGYVPISIIIFLGIIILTHFVLNRSSFGQKLYMVGANQKACQFSNVKVSGIIVIQYVFSACFAFFTSLIMIGQLNSVRAGYMESYLLVAVLATFLGGVNPMGGFGRLSGVVLAAVILQLISTGFILLRMDPFLINAMWGAIIVIVLFARDLMRVITEKWRLKTVKNI
jgi:simple sugar transport system permease protein